MNKKGFTLVETILGLFLLGLISVTVLPIINSSFIRLKNNKVKMEMIYIGEMAMEKIKAFNKDDTFEFIYDTKVMELIELFKSYDSIEVTVPKEENSQKYFLKINKTEKSDLLWKISIIVYHNVEGSNVKNVEYSAYIPQK